MSTQRSTKSLLAVLTITATLAAVPAFAAAPAVRDLTPQFAGNGFDVDRLAVYEVGGVVVLRGRTQDRAAAEAAGLYAQVLGFQRVANLIQVQEAPNDIEIRRQAERELAVHRALDGSRLSVQSQDGVVTLRGRVASEAQRDMALSVLRSVDGVRDVRAELSAGER